MLAIAAGLTLQACKPSDFPVVLRDDAGDQAWVRQVVPIVLGRKVKGASEVRLLTDLVQLTDRPTVLRGLMQQPEFQEHWSEVLVNTMRIDREVIHVIEPDQSDCYGPILRAGAPGSALAQHILTASPAMPAPGGAFNMSDVVRSAVALDNLAPLFRAHLFALEHHAPPLGLVTEQQARDEFGRSFGEVYLNRQNGCLACHNSDSSTTGPGSGWTRYYPILGSFEQALYGSSFGGDPLDIHEMFRTDQHSTGAGFTAPWGIASCGAFKADMGAASGGGSPYFTGPLAPGATVTTLASLFKQGYDGLALHGLARSVPAVVAAACNTCKTSCSGSTPLDPESVVNGPFVRDLLTAHASSDQCGGCHGGSAGLTFFPAAPGEHWYSQLINVPSSEGPGTRVIPGDAASSILIKKLRGTAPGDRMPRFAPPLSETDIQKVEAWINALPVGAATCTNCPTLDCDASHIDHNPEAFAYLTAARIVGAVWQESMGYPLTIANYFPRNPGQRGALWNLTEFTFIPSGWSLRELLVRILTANTFNRRPPDVQGGTATAYQEPPLYDPWQIPDPRIPPANQPGWDTSAHPDLYNNAMTDGIYRYSAWSLLRSTQKALDWPGPNRFPDDNYPSAQLERGIGQYMSSESPGFRVTNFPALLSWEKDHGVCANHRTDAGQDWLDRLAVAAAGFTPPASDPGPLTVRDLIRIEKDWLLGDGTIATVAPPPLAHTEEQALAGIVGSLDTAVSSLSQAALDGKLRSVCGLLLETPQFFLAGVAPDGPGAPTRLRVCNGTPCTYQQMCQDVTSHIPLGGTSVWSCGPDSVTTINLGRLLNIAAIDRTFCPECPVIQIDPKGCFDPAARACSVTPPACDARCNRVDCCGGPPARVDRKGTILLSGDGATVKQAAGARIRRAGSEKIETPAAGQRLAYGDVLELPPGATLIIDNAGREMKYQGKADGDLPPRYVMITGPQALQSTERKPRPPLPPAQLDWMRARGWLRSPDGSTPVTISPETRGPGAAERAWQDRLKRRQAKP